MNTFTFESFKKTMIDLFHFLNIEEIFEDSEFFYSLISENSVSVSFFLV
jgi:hypothetical protein